MVTSFRCWKEVTRRRRNASGLRGKPQCVRLRACRILLTLGRSFSPPATYFLATAPRSRQETPPRSLRRSIADAIDRSPALLGRGGVFRQAIPGLSKNASASLPRPRLRAAIPPRPVMLGAARRGGTSTAEKQKRKAGMRYAYSALPNSNGPIACGFGP